MFKNTHDLQAHHLLQVKGIDELLVCSLTLTLSPLGEVSPFPNWFNRACFKAAPVY